MISTNDSKDRIVLPFLKWAGGKRWLADNYSHLIPADYNNYIEPFVGSGALFFYISPKKAVLSDINRDLIETYQAIQSNWRLVVRYLKEHRRKHSREYYYELRGKEFRSTYNKAAQFIYLNRTCWNGLYRVNRLGKFNVPVGNRDSVFLSTDDFESISRRLKGVELFNEDFEKIIKTANKGDLVFVDPPYTIAHNLNGFVKYNETLFSWEDQVRLRDAVMVARGKGANVVVTNANHPAIRKLYKEFEQFELNRRSAIAASPQKRGIYGELLIRG